MRAEESKTFSLSVFDSKIKTVTLLENNMVNITFTQIHIFYIIKYKPTQITKWMLSRGLLLNVTSSRLTSDSWSDLTELPTTVFPPINYPIFSPLHIA
jgi:hypothetical protein